MASTIAFYTGDGTTTDFTVPFDYLAKKFVRVSLGVTILKGGDYGDTSKDYYFLDKTKVRLKVPPASGEVLTIRRYTSATDRVVSFKDASVLKATDLDVSSVQTIHIAEEARDIINDAIIKDREGNWDAKGNRIVNVGTPEDDSDAMTYGVYKADALGALQSKIDAEKAKDRAIEAETNSKKSEENAKLSETKAKLSETKAKASEDNAISASTHADEVRTENRAIIEEAREIIAEDRVLHKETKDNTVITVARADEAVLSAKNSKNSEVNAKKSEEAVTSVANVIVPIAPEIKIVADNIDHVVTDSNSIDKINIVGTDLSGILSDTIFDDFGDLGNPSAPMPTITGGNIKTVADNIESVRTVAGLAPDFEIAIESVDTVNSLTIRAENASKSAETSANIATAKADIATAKATEAEDSATSASQSATSASASAKNASASASTATTQATNASNSAKAAKLSEDSAALSKTAADTSETNAKASEVEAKKQADLAKGYADQAASGQINSDWAETDTTSKAFILNKPTLGALASKDSIAYSEITGTPPEQDLSGLATKNELQTGLASKANTKHTHTTAQVTGLDTALAGKAPMSHTHTSEQITDLTAKLNAKLDVATFNGYIDYGDLGS